MSADATAAPRTRGPRRSSNEDAVIAAALEAFSVNGFNGASMREIANRAGTSLSNLYNYVPAKADLLARVLQRANDDLLECLNAALDETDETAVGRLGALVRAYVGWSIRQQTAGTVALGEFRYLTGDQRKDVVEARDRTQRLFTDVVRAGTESGEFGTEFPASAARNVVLLCSALVTWFHPDGRRTADEVADEQVRLALAMVEARELD